MSLYNSPNFKSNSYKRSFVNSEFSTKNQNVEMPTINIKDIKNMKNSNREFQHTMNKLSKINKI